MHLSKEEMRELIDQCLDQQKIQIEINKNNSESINELITRNRFLSNRIDYLETECDRYKRAYQRMYWQRKDEEKKAAEVEKNLKNFFNERTDN